MNSKAVSAGTRSTQMRHTALYASRLGTRLVGRYDSYEWSKSASTIFPQTIISNIFDANAATSLMKGTVTIITRDSMLNVNI